MIVRNAEKEGKPMKKAKKIVLPLLYVAVLVGLAAFGGIYFKKYRDIQNHPPTVDQTAKAQMSRTLSDVGKLYALPKDEEPKIYTVTDPKDLKDQPFFDKSQKDDIALVYAKNKLAVLYRPSSKQIINVSTVSIQDQTAKVIKVYGPGRAAVEAKLTTAKVTNSDGGDVTATLTGVTVVDVTGGNADAAAAAATAAAGQVGNLPEGVTKPTGVDIAVYAAQ